MNILHRLPKWLPDLKIFLQIADKRLFSRNDFCIFVLVIYLDFCLPVLSKRTGWRLQQAAKRPASRLPCLSFELESNFGAVLLRHIPPQPPRRFIDEVVE